jgi:AGCS family alanine or glycine:cation symporter
VISYVNSNILSPIVTVLLLISGVYFTFRLRLSPGWVFQTLISGHAGSGISPFRALTVALAGTLGVGNIVGVASAISLGGPGAVFWMWVSAILVMALKYAEVSLAVKYRQTEKTKPQSKSANNQHIEAESEPSYYGGPFYYIRDGLGMASTAKLYAVVLALDSFALGCIIQTKSAADGMAGAFGMPNLATGAIIGALMLAVTLFGISGISEVTVRLIPFLTVGYTLLSLCIILPFTRMIPEIIGEIVHSAFTPAAIPGAGVAGITGVFNLAALRYGVARGIFSNEAGCGSSGIAHAAANTRSPADQGAWGVFEVFTDTIVLCGLTAFVMLIARRLSPNSTELLGGGMDAVSAAYGGGIYSAVLKVMGAAPEICAAAAKLAVAFIGSSICAYALATVISWSHYGAEALRFLTGKRSGGLRAAYLCCCAVFCAVGSVTSEGLAWEFADIAVAMMTMINTVCVLRLRREVPLMRESLVLRTARLKQATTSTVRRSA